MKKFLYKNLNFKNRKKIHYGLIACIVGLQILAIIVWYNETINEEKLMQNIEDTKSANQLEKQSGNLTAAIIESQKHFNNYIQNKNKTSLENYFMSVAETKSILDSLQLETKKNKRFNLLWKKKQNAENNILKINATIDSIINKHIDTKTSEPAASFVFSPFHYNKILDSVKTKTYVSVDSVARKGLFGRILSALSGKVEIQKEHSNTVVTMKYMDKVKSGTVEEQMKRLFQITNFYYKKQFEKLNASFLGLKKKEMELMNYNNQLLLLIQTTLPDFIDSTNKFKTESQAEVQKQLETNKAIRSYSIVALIILMIIVSVLLFGLTQLSFEYEKQLTDAQEKIKQNLSFKNRIMGMISHEIRSPLSIISLYSNKISQSVKDEEIKDTFKSIQFTTSSLLLLSNQILEYSKDENQKLILKNKNFYLKSELNQILKAMESLVESHNNELKVNMNLKSDELVDSDVAKIHQLFYNIIGNANKFTENGVISVDIKQSVISDFELKLDVSIQDNGTGIAKEDLEKIFDSFYQGTTNTTTHNLGVGLGLNLCKEIIELLEGEIKVDSTLNKGTNIVFHLVLARV